MIEQLIITIFPGWGTDQWSNASKETGGKAGISFGTSLGGGSEALLSSRLHWRWEYRRDLSAGEGTSGADAHPSAQVSSMLVANTRIRGFGS